MVELLLEPWTHPYFLKAVVGGSIVAVTCAVLGCYIVLRRMAFIGDAMSHALLPGVGIGYLVMNALLPGGFTAGGLLLGALIAALLTSVCISFLSAIPRIKEDSAIGIIYTGLFAAGVVILTRFQQHINIDLNHFFQGDIYGISWPDLWLSAVIGTVVIGAIIIFYRHFTIVSFDPIMAASIGLPTRLLHTLLTVMIALVCVSGISMVGVIMIVGLLITPAALAHLLADRLPVMMILAAGAGILSVVLGLYFSEWVNASGGGAIMFVGFLLFLVGLVLAPRYGILASGLRRRAVVPQRDVEDVLKCAYGGASGFADLPMPGPRRIRAVKKMIDTGFLEPDSLGKQTLMLTRKGQQEAAHIMRAHQLWEAHLMKTGLDPAEAHQAAEKLEHLHPREVLDQFDDELGHPVVDVDGITVPGESKYIDAGYRPLTLSLLREGDRGRFLASKARWPNGIQEGMEFVVGPRVLDTNQWQVAVEGRPKRTLSHEEADQLLIVPHPEAAP